MMLSLIVVLNSLCLVPGMVLRATPFAGLVTRRRLWGLVGIYTAASILNAFILWLLIPRLDASGVLLAIRVDGVLFATVLTAVNILVIRGHWREHLFVFGVVLSCNYQLLAVPTLFVDGMTQLEGGALLAVASGLYLVLLLLTNYPLRRLLRHTVEPFLDLDSGDYWQTVWFLPIVLFLAMFVAVGADVQIHSLVQLGSRALYALVMILMCLNIARDHVRLRERQAMTDQLTAQKLHYAALQVKLEDARKTRHDFKHHVAAIRRYMELDDKKGLGDYCDGLVRQDYGQSKIPYTGNVAADGVLYHYMQLAQNSRVRFEYAGVIRSHGIADMDLSVLLGNALDNALAGCMTRSEGRSIALVSQSEKRLLSIMVRNTFDGRVDAENGGIRSRKREGRSGVGLASMESICKRYGGSMELQWDAESFTVLFLLPLAEPEA